MNDGNKKFTNHHPGNVKSQRSLKELQNLHTVSKWLNYFGNIYIN